MTPSEPAVSETAGRLRRALERGSFAQARVLLAQYGGQTEAALRRLPPGSAERAELAREAGEMLAWARRMALASRAAAATRLARLPRPVRAYRVAPPSRHSFELRA